MPDLSILTADAGASLAPVVAGPPRAARVLAAFPDAIYLAPEGDRVIGIETSDGVGLPNALRLRAPSAGLGLASTDTDAPAEVGGSRVLVGGREIAVDRWVEHTYRPAGIDTATLGARLTDLEADLAGREQLDDELAARVDTLAEAVPTLEHEALLAAARDLVGLGGGLTPSGDDVLCGLLAVGRTLGRALGDEELDRALHRLGGALQTDAAERTTALSASLLWHAARAELARPAHGLLRALLGRTPLQPATDALVAVGHTSGRDLAVGMRLAAATALARAENHTTGAAR